MKYLPILLIFTFQLLEAQVQWKPVSDGAYSVPEDLAMEKNGNLYLSTKGNDLIFQCNINQETLEFRSLPKVLNRFFRQSEHFCNLFLDFNDTLIALTRFGPYRYFGTHFAKDTVGRLDTNYASFSTSFIMKYNLKGDFFGSFPDAIFLYKDKWKNDRNHTVYSCDIGQNILNFWPFDDENNYALVNDGNPDHYIVFKYNTKTLERKRIFETNTPMHYLNLTVTKDGHIFAGTSAGLYHSFNDGKDFEVSLIDTSLGHSSISRVCQSKSGDFIVAQLVSGFYASFDKGKTWTRLHFFNQNIPGDQFSIWEKVEMIDTAHAAILIRTGCYTFETYVLNPHQGGWKKINPPIFKINAYNLMKSPAGRLFAHDDGCKWIYSDDEGQQWQSLTRDGEVVQNLIMDDKGQIFSFDRPNIDNRILYKSNDDGRNWHTSEVFPGRIQGLFPFSDGSMMLLLSTNNSLSYTVYYSTNRGVSWVLQNSLFTPSREISRIIKGSNETFYAFQSGTREFLISRDQGRTWQSDDRLNNISNRSSMFFDERGNFFCIGSIGGVHGIYRSSDLVQFENISPKGASVAQGIFYIAPGIMVASFSRSGIMLTTDDGQSWVDITGDLEFDIASRTYGTNSFIVDSQGRMFLARAYDGIYRTVDPIVSTDNPPPGMFKPLLYPNPFEEYLNIKLDKDHSHLGLRFLLHNQLGQKVFDETLSGPESVIKLPHLPSGLYLASIMSLEGTISTGLIFRQ